MPLVFANNAGSTLAVSANLSATSLTVGAGEGVRFPAPTGGDTFIATLQDGVLFEIIECTGRVGDVLTVVRARESTSAQTWGVGTTITMRPTAGTMAAMEQRARALLSFASINGPIVLTADPTLPTHATRRSWVESQITTVQTALNTRIDGASPIGSIRDWPGLDLPAKHLWCAGQAVNRTTYAALFAAITKTMTVTVSSGSPTVTVTTGNTTNLAAGMPVSISTIYFTLNATVVSFTGSTVTLSSNALTGAAGIVMTVCPHGIGNNSTTFNVPDRRGRVGVGRDNMNGTAANRVTVGQSGLNGILLGAAGGDERLHTHGHGLTQSAHGHGVNDSGHVHGITNEYVAPFAGIGYTTAPGGVGTTFYYVAGGTQSAVTGISIQSNTIPISVDNGGTGAAQNVQPSNVTNYIIFADV